MTRLVCSICQASLAEDDPQCPRCGPQALTLIISDEAQGAGRGGDGDVGRRLARALGAQYELVRLLGQGGFAEVYEVKDANLHRRLAVKVLRPDLAWTAGMLARFKQEARAIARLHHPHTVPIHFVGEGEGLVYYAMPFIEGRSLADLLRSGGALDVERALAIAEPIVDALEHAHRHGLVHRDIKPDNILIEADTGRPLLLDFGIAKSLDGGDHHTQTGLVVGTPLYMSPEQALGHRSVDARTDVYAMGAVLFQMLTGAPPFEGGTSQEIVSKHLNEPVPIGSLSGARIPRWLSSVILRCMAKHADDRYPSAAALLEALRTGRAAGAAAGADDAVTAHRVAAQIGRAAALPPQPVSQDETPTESIAPSLERPARRGWRRRALVAGVGLIVVGMGTAVAIRPRAALTVANRFDAPVAIMLNGDSLRTIAPGDSVIVRVPAGKPVSAQWSLVRPAAPEGGALGEEVRGTLVIDDARGAIRRVIDARSTAAPTFAPILENATDRPLRATVTGASGSYDCRCTVQPGATFALGRYQLGDSATVRVTDDRGQTAELTDLTARIDSAGVVLLRVTAADFPSRVPAAASPKPAAPPDTTPAAPPRERNDPLRGIFPGR